MIVVACCVLTLLCLPLSLFVFVLAYSPSAPPDDALPLVVSTILVVTGAALFMTASFLTHRYP